MSPDAGPPPVIATLTLNPALDVSTLVERMVPERKLRCAAPRYDPGGGGVNVARVISRLGGRPHAIFTAGGPSGARLQQLLSREGLEVTAVPIGDETRQDLTVLDQSTGEQFRFVMPGPRLKAAELRLTILALDGLVPSPDIVVASGSLPPGTPAEVYGRLARRLRRRGGKLALDASGAGLAAGLAAGVWLVKPNLAELEDLAGAQLVDDVSRLRACRALIGAGSAQIVALSLGADGAMLVSDNGAWRTRPLDLTSQSTIGAGDSFLAGLVWALAGRCAHPEALRQAVAAASATVLQPGTKLGSRAMVRSLRAQVEVLAL